MKMRRGFNYVGFCQSGWHYIFSSWPFCARIGVACRIGKKVSTAKRPRRGHSTIRVQNNYSFSLEEFSPSSEKQQAPTHETTYGRNDAHSPLRALTVEVLSHKTSRAVEPRFSLRGPANTHSSWI